MNEEFPSLNLPDFESLLTSKINTSRKSAQIVDPYTVMLNRKNTNSEFDIHQQWPEKDISDLEDFCKSNGIIGFDCKKMNPKLALNMLKKQVGDFTGVPVSERIVDGYEKLGTKSSQISNKKSILLG